MSDMKCPVCNVGYVHKSVNYWYCDYEYCPSYDETDLKTYDILIRTHNALDVAVDGLLAVWRATDHTTKQGSIAYNVLCDLNIKPLDRIKALEQKDVK